MATDYFDPRAHSNRFKLSGNNCTATKTGSNNATAYLKQVVNSGIHQWKFKIIQHTSSCTVDIGIWKTKNIIVKDQYIRKKGKAYLYGAPFARLSKGDVADGNNPDYTFGKRCVEGDIIEMTLDLNKRELRFSVNARDYGVAFKVENTSYRAAVSIYYIKDSVQLLSYSTNDAFNNDDFKYDECDKLKETVQALKKEKDDIVRENEAITSSLQQRITELERAMNAKEIGLQQKLEQLQQKNEKLKQEIETIQNEKAEIQQKYNQVNESNIKLNEECKELQTDLTEMTKKYNTLYRKSNIDESNYMNWDSDNITDWIINLDSQFEAYENSLRENLKKEDVDGSILGELDKQDFHRFGVISMKHKLAITKQIKRLTNQQQQQQAQQQLPSYEGNNATAYI